MAQSQGRAERRGWIELSDDPMRQETLRAITGYSTTGSPNSSNAEMREYEPREPLPRSLITEAWVASSMKEAGSFVQLKVGFLHNLALSPAPDEVPRAVVAYHWHAKGYAGDQGEDRTNYFYAREYVVGVVLAAEWVQAFGRKHLDMLFGALVKAINYRDAGNTSYVPFVLQRAANRDLYVPRNAELVNDPCLRTSMYALTGPRGFIHNIDVLAGLRV